MHDSFPRIATRQFLSLAALALVVVALILCAVAVRVIVSASFHRDEQVRSARLLISDLLREQLDEETGIRGYAAARDLVLLEPYYTGVSRLPVDLAGAATIVGNLGLGKDVKHLADARQTNARWLPEVAAPTIAGARASKRLELNGKRLIDRFRSDIAPIEGSLAARQLESDDLAQRAIFGISLFALASIAAVILAAGLFIFQQERLAVARRRSAELRAAYDVEKRIADTLQSAFVQNVLPAPARVSFSAAYVPATEEPNIGGDWYDAFELAEDRVLLTIGDVTGHGLEAAVTMNRTRQLFISCALANPDPGAVLTRVNGELLRTGSPIVTAIAGLVNGRTHEFDYAVAGHPPPVLAEPGSSPRLLEAGSLPLGLSNAASYRTRRVRSVPGGMLVLYTDGAIEHSRDVLAGEARLLAAVAAAAGRPELDAATAIFEGVLPRGRLTDDVAILTIRFREGSNPGDTRRFE